jgi:phage virion morphogenesis protein
MADRPYQADSRGVVIGMHELAALRKRFAEVSDQLTGDAELADAIGDQQANSARKRIRETKRAPDGKRWKPWSESYRKTRLPHHSLLVGRGDLGDSMTHDVRSNTEVAVGSPLVYGRVHLYGSRPGAKPKITARPYLDTEPGFADPSDRAELREILRAFWVEKGIKRSRR